MDHRGNFTQRAEWSCQGGACWLLLLCCSILTEGPELQAAPKEFFKEANTRSKTEQTRNTKRTPPNKRDWLYQTLEINYTLFNTVDLLTTFYGLENGAREVNPIARSYINNKPTAVAIKGGLTLGVLWALRQAKKENRGAAIIALGTLNLLYGVVVSNNIGVVMRLN